MIRLGRKYKLCVHKDERIYILVVHKMYTHVIFKIVYETSTCMFQVHNVNFSYERMMDGGLARPKARPEGKSPPGFAKLKILI